MVEEAMFYTICVFPYPHALLQVSCPHRFSSQHVTRICAHFIWKADDWNVELESNVWSERPRENSAKHDNKGQSRTLPMYLYWTKLPTVQPQDFTLRSKVATVPVKRGNIRIQTMPDCRCLSWFQSLNKSAYQNEIKKLLLDVLNCEDDYFEVSKLIKHFATLT